ncbi:MAG: riboflavin synthase subunit alpha [Thiohalomonadaceae bacterium]|jgi:riboflavin synthase
MFTGIIQATAEIISIAEKPNLRTHTLRLPRELLSDLQPGASVAHNGCCLTVVSINDDQVSFDLMSETLRLTNLASLKAGDCVNIERAARFGDEIGGHAMSGHIMATAEITQIHEEENKYQIWFQIPENLQKYIFSKGYIGIDGISLTIGQVKAEQFCANLIPETLARTTIASYHLGDRVNIEIDPQTQAIVDTVERVLAGRGTS